jgi:hypothetical protein
MARGFESKAVADQQETAQARRGTRPSPRPAVDPRRSARKRRLELARIDVERQLASASAPAYRQMLERALRALVQDIQSLG